MSAITPLTLPADAGEPMSVRLVAGPRIKKHRFPAITRGVSLRNTGPNTLWVLIEEKGGWFDVASGTSWDERVHFNEFWYCTQTGTTRVRVVGLALTGTTAAKGK